MSGSRKQTCSTYYRLLVDLPPPACYHYKILSLWETTITTELVTCTFKMASYPNHHLEPKQANLLQGLSPFIASAHLSLCIFIPTLFLQRPPLLHPESGAAQDKCDCFKEIQACGVTSQLLNLFCFSFSSEQVVLLTFLKVNLSKAAFASVNCADKSESET